MPTDLPSDDLPLPRRQRYTVERVILNVEADYEAVQGVTKAVHLPEPTPAESFDAMDIVAYILALRVYARRALALLEIFEKGIRKPEGQLPAHMRVTISIIGPENRVFGTILGDGKAYGPHGNQLSRSRPPRL
jgi:hypothetical protein